MATTMTRRRPRLNAMASYYGALGRVNWLTKAGKRKVRLFAVACCRQIWGMVPEEARDLVEAAERYADGLTDKAGLLAAAARLERARDGGWGWPAWPRGLTAPWWAVQAALAAAEVYKIHKFARWSQEDSRRAVRAASKFRKRDFLAHGRRQVTLMACIFGPEGDAPAVEPAWLAWNNGTVRRMAESIYQERRWADLPILADALDEAGCDNRDILAHCRSGGEHARGCWVVDLLLGRG
jgi:hypothetical protein